MSTTSGDASFNGIVRRMVSIPRTLMGGVSRAIGFGTSKRRPNQNQNQNQFQFQFQTPEPNLEWGFISSFEHQYGTHHPFFFACTFMEALRMAQNEQKFVFLYLHSPQHPFTPYFCAGTLCSDLVTQFLDANFVSWGAIADAGEGIQIASALRPATFPFCAVIAPANGDSMAVLQQMEGPVGPGELVEILQRTMEEQGLAFRSAKHEQEREGRVMEMARDEERAVARAMEDEKLRADRRLRAEQDAAFSAALQRDKVSAFLNLRSSFEKHQELWRRMHIAKTRGEKERLRNGRAQTAVEEYRKANGDKLAHTHVQNCASKTKQASLSQGEKEHQTTQLLIRFQNGEKREQSFCSTDKILAVYHFIDSLRMPGLGNYRLMSSFPRRVYGADQMGMTLKDAGLHPRASLFLELM